MSNLLKQKSNSKQKTQLNLLSEILLVKLKLSAMKHSLSFILLLFIFGCADDNILNSGNDIEQLKSASGNSFPEVLSLPNGLQPEGIAIGSTHTFYVGSLVSGQIFKGDLQTGDGEVLITPPMPMQALGLAVDERSNYLYVAGGFTGTGSVYNCTTGEHIQTFAFAVPGTALINDVTLTKDAAYFTNSISPLLYKIPLGKNGQLPDPSLVITLPLIGFSMTPNLNIPNLGAFSNGIDAIPSGKTLILANTDRGELYSVNPNTGESSVIDLGGALLPFADGILLEGKTLYVVQNMLNQVTVIELTNDLFSGSIVKTIQDSKFGVPTTIDKFGNFLYAVNAHFDLAPPTGLFPNVEFEVVKVEK